MITRERAREIAATCVERGCTVAGRVRVCNVASIEELVGRVPMIYGYPADQLSSYWIAYVERSGSNVIESSRVLLVSKRDGSIAYQGSANDEG